MEEKLITIDDVLDARVSPQFETILDRYLDQLPSKRSSVEELLYVLDELELCVPIYNKLFFDYSSLLTEEEKDDLAETYWHVFGEAPPV